MNKMKGLILSLVLAIPCHFLGKAVPVVGGPVFGILLGILLGNMMTLPEGFNPGITFTSKKILQAAVVLLGFGLNMKTVVKVGSTGLPIIVATISTALILSYFLAKALDIPSKIAILVGVGSSICGGSAIAATAPVISADDHEIAQAISVIFLFNVIAALIFPTLGNALGFSNEGFALFAGTAVNDTSSVTAAASAWDAMKGTGTEVLDGATIVKLTRTLAIIPITMTLAYRESKKNHVEEQVSLRKIFPTFIAYFLLASILTTVLEFGTEGGWIGESLSNGLHSLFGFLKGLSKFFIIMAMTAIGLNTHVKKMISSGGKPVLQGFLCWVAIAGVSIGLQKIMGIF